MTSRLQKLNESRVAAGFAPREDRGELTIEVKDAKAAALKLRDEFGFEQLIDLCGVDYASYGDRPRDGQPVARRPAVRRGGSFIVDQKQRAVAAAQLLSRRPIPGRRLAGRRVAGGQLVR